MELRDFAERVLLGTSLADKLDCPTIVTDSHPGSPLIAPANPGRPNELLFKRQHSGKAEFPSLHRLEHERERGRLLHFFANHELLATELMALVLLRFPEAPPSFRRGVLRTLKDEQQHTRWYLQRMEECGIHFGELPVSGYFWRAISGMTDPMDYVAGLSLTFEQANLDFARYFARGFETVGDAESAKLLNKIYQDEIGHVAYGLKWFRRWKDPGQSDWQAFSNQLKFPLSPARAKGISLNVEGRRAAGFQESFIDELSVYSQSKGRTPAVFIFNPFAEGYIARGNSFNPVKHQAQLARDLENLPQYLALQDDIVLLEKRPATHFLSTLKQAGFTLPQLVERHNFVSALGERKLKELRPWAWGPDSIELLNPLFKHLSGPIQTADQCFNAGIAQLYSKAWSAAFLGRVLRSREPEAWLCDESIAGTPVENTTAALQAISDIRARGRHKIVVKEALGLAGHNAIRLWEPELLDTQRRWMENALRQGRQLVVEPWLERVADFSLQLEMASDGLVVAGYTGLQNDLKGQYQANWAAPNYARRIPATVLAAFGVSLVSRHIHEFYAQIFAQLETELTQAGYRGPVGIDALVYRTQDGQTRLKPIVEINPRFTMGRVLVELMKRVCSGSYGILRLVNRAAIRKEYFENFESYASSLTKAEPLRLEGQPVPKIREGTVCLNDPSQAQVCLAVFQVRRNLSLGAEDS